VLTRIMDLDLVFIGYDEPAREVHWQDLQTKVPRALRIDGIKGFTSAFQAAARAARTERFVTIDADCRMDAAFLDHPLADDAVNSNKVLSWPTRNVVNGLAYGNGGLKCWTRSMLLSCRTTDGEHVDHVGDFGFIFESRVFGTCHPNGSPLQAFRSGFREGVRLGLVKGAPVGLDRLNHDLPSNNLRRLVAWCTIGADVHLGGWCILGAREGFLQAQTGTLDWALLADYERFVAFFAAVHARCGGAPEAASRRAGERLRTAGFAVADLTPRQSAFFRDQSADQVDVVAFDTLGNEYRTGRDLPNRPDKAFEAYRTGALLGHGNAMNNVARCYREGLGVGVDPVAARNWLLNAAAVGNPWALSRLGKEALAAGDAALAAGWLERAAAAGNREALSLLETLTANGPGEGGRS
jgi:hypothetical protein